jgi:hypothetical protein
VSSTVVLTVYEAVEMTVICAVSDEEVAELLEAVLLEAADAPVEAPVDAPVAAVNAEPVVPPLPVDDDDVDPDPVTCWPTVRSTEATVPAMVEVRPASVTSVCAVVSWV